MELLFSLALALSCSAFPKFAHFIFLFSDRFLSNALFSVHHKKGNSLSLSLGPFSNLPTLVVFLFSRGFRKNLSALTAKTTISALFFACCFSTDHLLQFVSTVECSTSCCCSYSSSANRCHSQYSERKVGEQTSVGHPYKHTHTSKH